MSIDDSVAREERAKLAANAANGESPTASAGGTATSGTAPAGSSPVPKRRRKWRTIAIAAILVVASLAAIRWIVRDYTMRSRFEAAAAKARAAGWAVNAQDQVWPSIPAEENAAVTLTRLPERFPLNGVINIGFNRVTYFGEQFTDRDTAALDAPLQECMSIITAACALPTYQESVPLDTPDWYDAWHESWPRWLLVRRTVQVEFQIAMRKKEYPRAYRAIETALRIGRLEPASTQSTLGMPLERHDCINALEALIAVAPPDLAQQNRLDELLRDWEEHHRAADVLRMDCLVKCMVLDSADHELIEKEFSYFLAGGPNSPRTFQDQVMRHLQKSGTSIFLARPSINATKAALIDRMMAISDLIDEPGEAASTALDETLAVPMGTGDELFYLSDLASSSSPRTMAISPKKMRISAMLFRQRLIHARLGLRAIQYKAVHGQWPKSLEVLVDEALPEVPPDLFTGQPLEMIQDGDNLVIRPENMQAFEQKQWTGWMSGIRVEFTVKPKP